MGKINKQGMDEVAKQRENRKSKLESFIKNDFDLENKEQQLEFKKYIDSFELSVNQMYLYQGASYGLGVWGCSWGIGKVLPIPDFLNYFFVSSLYLGAAGYILGQFRTTDFFDQLQEMKAIYKWCFQAKQEDNPQKLLSTEVQRLIKLLAPLCDADFMIVWPRELPKVDEKNPWSKTLSAGYLALSATASIFFRSPAQSTIAGERLKQLKINVEKNELNLSAYSGFEQAIRYFATSPEFRTFITSKLQKPLDIVQQLLPGAVLEAFHAKLS